MNRLARNCTALSLLLAARLAFAETVTGRFDLDALPDTLTYDVERAPASGDEDPDGGGTVTIRITLATPDARGRVVVRKRSFSERGAWVHARNPGEIVVSEKGDVASSTTYHSIYRYNPRVQDWLLVEELSEDKLFSERGWVHDIRISYPGGAERLGGGTIDAAQAETESAAARRTRLAGELAALHARLAALDRAHGLSKLPESPIDSLGVAELLQNVPVSAETVTAYNDVGYYLVLTGNDVARFAAIDLLEQVVKARPDRTPAYLNLADACFDLEVTGARAKGAYARYVELMTREGKASKIPRRAIDRMR